MALRTRCMSSTMPSTRRSHGPGFGGLQPRPGLPETLCQGNALRDKNSLEAGLRKSMMKTDLSKEITRVFFETFSC
eukprot:1804779-Rhodomonas_salina.1